MRRLLRQPLLATAVALVGSLGVPSHGWAQG